MSLLPRRGMVLDLALTKRELISEQQTYILEWGYRSIP